MKIRKLFAVILALLVVLSFAGCGEIIYGTPEPLPVLEYSTDGTTWEDFVIGATKIELTDGKKVYFRGDNNSFSDDNGYLNFKISGSIAASGNIMSLLDKTCKSIIIPNNYCFLVCFISVQLLIG